MTTDRTRRRVKVDGKWKARGRPDWLVSQPDPPTPGDDFGIWFSHFDNRTRTGYGAGHNAFDQLLADSIGAPRPIGTFIHGYSGSSHPSTFASSSVASAQSLNIGAMLNTKLDWAGLAAGTYDSQITAFFNSWPDSVHGLVTVNHEPENDGPTPAVSTNSAWVSWANANAPVWRAGVARYIRVAGAVIRARNLKVRTGGVLMDFSWDTDRWEWFKWWEEPGVQSWLDVTTFGIDAYWKHLPTPTIHGISPNSKVDLLLESVRGANIPSFSFWETAIDRRQRGGGNPVIGTYDTCTAWWNAYEAFLKTIPEVDYVCYFHTPGGPASDQAWLDGSTVAAYANICTQNRRVL